MGILDWLFGAKKTSALMEFMCSSCFEMKPGEQMHALPWWNAGEEAFFMTHRCPTCFADSLEETSLRIEHWDEDAETSFRLFLKNWEILRYFPQLQADSTREIASGVLSLVRDSNGKIFVPLALTPP